ncbi:DUF7144 family membrane protein [Agromyces bauzanensis]|uniref:DUF7144 domain-containing protein n=1 Tax=Agromyces bauzanensis TaxID=1308924 RepID=A0A917PNV4_9MICO|nr:hypothetical protein [Agromyces bauzanensis]GGJ86413.1 hypothetical protein GCM10011372_26040 [Agromyces bauzanensis]
MAEATSRPIGVAIVAVLAFVSGVIDIISGILLIFQGDDPDVTAAFGGSGGLLTAAIGSMVLGLIVVILSFGLWLGRWISRMIVTVLQILSLIGSLFMAVANLGNPVGEWASVLVSAIVLILLWTRPASAYFRGSEAALH